MYLIIGDPRLINDDSRYYYYCGGEYYNHLIQQFPELLTINRDAINEVLFYSFLPDDNNKKIKTAICNQYECGDGHIKVICTNIQTGDVTCDEIRRREYGYCVQNQSLVDDKYTPVVLPIESIQSYTQIKVGRMSPRYVSLMAKAEEYTMKHDWAGIVGLFPPEKQIASSEYWDDEKCLSTLAFALGKLALKQRNAKMGTTSRSLGFDPDQYFLAVSDRCLELNPKSSMHQSTRAYYYYELYMNQRREEDYQKAYDLYSTLIFLSKEYYKEEYRFVKLCQKHFENNCWKKGGVNDWLSASQSVLQGFKELIDVYPDLDADRKSKYRKCYLRSIFGYSGFSIDTYFTYWNDYVQKNLYGKDIRSYKLGQAQFQSIATVEQLLTQLAGEAEYADPSRTDLQFKPNYLEVLYRLAQIQQVEGIVYVMLGKDSSEYFKYFIASNEYLDSLLAVARERKAKGERFKFPDYTKVTRAINLYFLGQLDECHRCFSHAKEYMIYEQGCIYALCHDDENAIKVLSSIPSKDKCYHKAQRLILQIQGVKDED